ncbi:MAG: hypothetical protein WBO73_08020 [Gammaproteobacteria bacterium]
MAIRTVTSRQKTGYLMAVSQENRTMPKWLRTLIGLSLLFATVGVATWQALLAL